MQTVSVVVVSYNVRDFLRKCLGALGAQSQGLSLEVWVVDNASRDGSTEMVHREFPRVQILQNTANLGFARAANQALARVAGDFVVLLNPDAELSPNGLQELVSFLREHQKVGIVGGAVVDVGGTLDPACHRGMLTPVGMLAKALRLDRLFPESRRIAAYNMRWLAPDQQSDVIAVSGSFLMIRRETMDQIGLLDERFFLYGEDHDWCMRTTTAGWKVIYNPRAKAVHHKGASAAQNPRLARLALHQAFRVYYDKHWSRSDPWWKRWLVYLLVFGHSGLNPSVFWSSGKLMEVMQKNRLPFAPRD